MNKFTIAAFLGITNAINLRKIIPRRLNTELSQFVNENDDIDFDPSDVQIRFVDIDD